MIYDLFAASALIYWLIIAAVCIVLIATIDYENFLGATIALIALILFLLLFSHINPISYTIHNPVTALSIFIGYFVIGAFWCIVKWWFYCLREVGRFEDRRDRWLTVHGLTMNSLSDMQKKEMLKSFGYTSPEDLAPTPKANKEKIFGWIIYWPWSLVWTIINDPIRHIGIAIYNQISNTLHAISEKTFRKRFKELF